MAVEDRQGPRIAEADGADQGVGIGAESVLATAEDLAAGLQVDMHFQPDDRLPRRHGASVSQRSNPLESNRDSDAAIRRRPRSRSSMETLAGISGWRDRSPSAEVRFLGRSARRRARPGSRPAWIGGCRAAGPDAAGARRDGARRARRGLRRGRCAGDHDARSSRWWWSPPTACRSSSPAGDRVAAIHAGWRGLVAGVIAATLEQFAEPARLTAWIGPAIGPCCYEVGEEVAAPVVARSSAVGALARRAWAPASRPAAGGRDRARALRRRRDPASRPLHAPVIRRRSRAIAATALRRAATGASSGYGPAARDQEG